MAIECGDERVTYARAAPSASTAAATRCATRSACGRRSGSLLLLLDGPAFVYAFFGAIKIGAVPVPLNTLWKPADYRYVLNDSRARVLIVSEALLPRVDAIPRDRAAERCSIVVVADAATPGTSSVRRLAGAGLRRARRRADQPRRAGLLAVFVGQHRRARRAACTCSTTWSSAPSCSARACSASARATAASASPSCSSPTASATRCIFRSRSARPASSGRARRRAPTSTRRSSGTGRRCSSPCRPATA